MRCHWICIVFLFISLFTLSAESFERYDFTFYETIDDSVAIMNEERFGFDYTGYGFLGSTMTTGLYIRIGMQTPYSTLFSLFNNDKNNSSVGEDSTRPDIDNSDGTPSDAISQGFSVNAIAPDSVSSTSAIDSGTSDDSSKYSREFIFSFTIGPAFRHIISESVIWYMGMGISSIINTNTQSGSNNETISNFEIQLGSDLDMGFRLDLAEKTSLRIGVHVTTDLITYSNTSISGGTVSPSTTQSLKADMFTVIGEKSSTDVTGYIGLGHIFKPKTVNHYRYSNKTSILGGGTLTKI